MVIQFVKRNLICDKLFSVDSNDPYIAINGEEPITDQVALDELNHHQTTRVKSKVKISL